MKASNVEERLARARVALDGLSVGDAFGHEWFLSWAAGEAPLGSRPLPEPPWSWTDDTEQASGIIEVLADRGRIDQEYLAAVLARRHASRPDRGYTGGAAAMLRALAAGQSWKRASPAAFAGQGSLGNGAAMRVAPVGAFFSGDFEAVVEQARLSAEVTHAHSEGQAGAIAVALAVAWANAARPASGPGPATEMLAFVTSRTPPGETRVGIGVAMALPPKTSSREAAQLLGNGSRSTAPDTVPFALWCAAHHLNDYAKSLWATVAGLGDVDTTCAIVGAIVASHLGDEAIPPAWLQAREPLC